MDIEPLLRELEGLGQTHDAKAENRDRRFLNITRDTGELLAVLVKAGAVKRVLEVGTSNGYSTLWLASALPEGGLVTTLEIQPYKVEQARANFRRAGLDHRIEVVQADFCEYLRQSHREFDLVFLDSDRARYLELVQQIIASIRPGGLLVCDNAISHREEMQPFMDRIAATGLFTTALVTVGNGEFVACKSV